MLFPVLLFVQSLLPSKAAPDSAPAQPSRRSTYSGVAKAIDVMTPRIEATIAVDGVLDEAPWEGAALLNDFTQYNPVDGQAAQDSTQVLVWYAPDALYVGIRAFAPTGTVRGTLADRDKITSDDHVQLLLDTFNDNRRAFVFAVNPLGIQSDGVRSEGGGGGGRGGGGGGGGGGGPGGGGGGGAFSRIGLGNVDLSQDMIWQSKGRVTDFGYEVEVRIPFKAVRFQPGKDTWGLNVVRTTQRNSYQDAWAPTRRGSASILVQSGRLHGLHDLKRGLVLDATPVVTSATNGAADSSTAAGGAWRYHTSQEVGGAVRWGVTPNMTLNATMNPDFSQVEADAGQIAGDVRFALFFPELRPFFVEGGENFDAPQQLVYTRRITQPVAATKLTGKLGSTDVAVLSAIDAEESSASLHDHPLFNIVRVRRDLGRQSNMGLVYTDRRDGSRYNQVAAADARVVFHGVYQLAIQVGGSATDSGTGPMRGKLWDLSVDRSGRSWGFRNSLKGLSRDFTTQSGFVNRTDNVDFNFNQRYIYFGQRGRPLEQIMWFFNGSAVWNYDGFKDGAAPLETRLSLSSNLTFRGGWSISLTPAVTTDAFDPTDYSSYFVRRVRGATVDTVAFAVGSRVTSVQWQGRITTPQFSKFGGSINSTYGTDGEFLETARAKRLDISANMDVRPSPKVRVTATMLHQEFRRERDNSAILQANIPRLRLEYQLTRAIFFRFVGQYESRKRDALRDPSNDDAVVFRGSDGTYSASTRTVANGLRVDWLFSLLPSPGRVIYIGYGANGTESKAFRFDEMTRVRDALFVKVSYQWRVP